MHCDVAWEAVQAGFVSFQDPQTPVFIGYRPGSIGTPRDALAQPVCRLGGNTPRTEALRYQFPPVLQGDDESKSVDVVSSGLEALQLQTLQVLRGEPRSTVIVSSDGKGALLLPHIRALLGQAAEVRWHDKTLAAGVDRAAMMAAAGQAASGEGGDTTHPGTGIKEERRASIAEQARQAMEAFNAGQQVKTTARHRLGLGTLPKALPR